MRKHIPFGGMTTCPTDHEAHEGDSAIALHLIAEDEALRPIGLHNEELLTLPTGSRIALVHRHDTYTHLIIEKTDNGSAVEYLWTWLDDLSASTAPTLHHLLHADAAAHSLTAIGNTICLAYDEGLTYGVWQEEEGDYHILRRSDLLYGIAITQDQQLRKEVTLPIEGQLRQHLDAPSEVLASRPSLPGKMFSGFYNSDDAYVTGATMTAARMEAAIERECVQAGQGYFRHACLGIAALRLHDGTHFLCSNLFGLWPAQTTDTLTADRETDTLKCQVWLHRHSITVDLPHPDAVACVASGVDIFLSRPLTFLDLRRAINHTTDTDGHTTSLTFGHLGKSELLHLLDNCAFHWATTVDITQAGQPILLQPSCAAAPTIDLRDLRREDFGAHLAVGHSGNLTIGDLTPLLHHPLEITVEYRYGPSAIAGIRPDNGGEQAGRTADLVVHATTRDNTTREVWWQGQVPYPLPGMVMTPGVMLRQLDYHLKINEEDGEHYYALSQPLDTLPNKDMSVAVFATTGTIHSNETPLWQSLVLQQARMLTYDPTTGSDTISQLLWQEETAAEFEWHAAHARTTWAMSRKPSTLRTATQHHLHFPTTSETQVGNGRLLALTPHLRRSADSLFGDGQYDAFCSDGVWMLRLSEGRWKARQTQELLGIVPGTRPLAVEGGTVFITARGVMLLKGSEAKCLSDNISGQPLAMDTLPQFEEIVATEPDITLESLRFPRWTEEFLDGAELFYDAAHHRLWVFNAQTDDEGRHRWPVALVCALRTNAWGVAATNITSTADIDGKLYAVAVKDGHTTLGSISFRPQGRLPVLLCTRPWTLGRRHRHATLSHLIVRGLFLDRGAAGSHIGVALYGSNDLHHWQLIGTSAGQYLCRQRGTPYKWFRLVAIGRLLPDESIEGVSIC